MVYLLLLILKTTKQRENNDKEINIFSQGLNFYQDGRILLLMNIIQIRSQYNIGLCYYSMNKAIGLF